MAEFTERDRLLAAKIGKKPEELAPHVRVLLEHNVSASPEDYLRIEKAMHALMGKVYRSDYEDFFIKLCTGLQYTAEKTHIKIPNVQIVDRFEINNELVDGGLCFYQPHNKLIIQRWFIEEIVNSKKRNIGYKNPYLPGVTLSPDDVVVLGGVEEGYHAYQWLVPEKKAVLQQLKKQEPDKSLHDKIWEDDAVPFKQQALKELGLGPYRQTQTGR